MCTPRTGPVFVVNTQRRLRGRDTYLRVLQTYPPAHPYGSSIVARSRYATTRREEVASGGTPDLALDWPQTDSRLASRWSLTFHPVALRLEFCKHNRHDGQDRD